eukprot:gene33536-41384_t
MLQSAGDVLELGGGLTALAGLGISASGLCRGRVVITDGHPDCVANQVLFCIGLALGEKLIALGHTVIAAGRRQEQLDQALASTPKLKVVLGD